MRILVPLFLASALTITLSAQAPKGKGGPPKNLKVLTPQNLMTNMRSFVPALGLGDKGGCNFCHVEGDRASDAKPEKVTARMMIQMVNDINSKFPDGKVHVACYTCHRGSTMPLMAPPAQ